MIFDLNVMLTSFIITQIDPLNQLRNVIDKFFTTYNYIHYLTYTQLKPLIATENLPQYYSNKLIYSHLVHVSLLLLMH